jgi:hypothetical protein
MYGIGRFLFMLSERERMKREKRSISERRNQGEGTRDTKGAAGNRKEKNSDLNYDIILF